MFEWYNVPKERRVALVATYFDDMVDAWFHGWTRTRENYIWGKFTEKLCERFRERSMSDTIEEFNKLRQVRNVGSYLRSLMSNLDPYLSKVYFVSSFLSSLSEGLRPMVKMIRPQTVEK